MCGLGPEFHDDLAAPSAQLRGIGIKLNQLARAANERRPLGNLGSLFLLIEENNVRDSQFAVSAEYLDCVWFSVMETGESRVFVTMRSPSSSALKTGSAPSSAGARQSGEGRGGVRAAKRGAWEALQLAF